MQCLSGSVIMALLLLGAGSASAAVQHVYLGSVGPEGSTSKQHVGYFGRVSGIAVDESTGDVYVYDSQQEGVIYKFDSTGAPNEFTALKADMIDGVGSDPGHAENQIAVDSSTGGVARGYIYVATGLGNQVRVYNSEGVYLGEVSPAAASPQSGGEPCGVAVDTSGSIYVGYFSGHVDKYTPTDANPAHDVFDSQLENVGEICNVAVGSGGSVYTAIWPAGPITKYGPLQFSSPLPSGGQISASGSSMAVTPGSADDVYVDEGAQIAEYESSGELEPKLLGTFAASGPGSINGSYVIAADAAQNRLYVSSGEEVGQMDVNIFSIGTVAPVLDSQSVSAVSANSATFEAKLNPGGLGTTYHFEYDTLAYVGDTSHGTSVPIPGMGIGAGITDEGISLDEQGLSPGTIYHFRVVATNSLGTVYGPDQSFTTRVVGSAFELPDDRSYELVSPPDKAGNDVLNIEGYGGGGVVQASEDGAVVTYLTLGPPPSGAPANAEGSQLISNRGSQGWETRDIDTRRTGPAILGVGGGTEYRVFSSDLSKALLEPNITTPLGEGAPTGFGSVYRRSTPDGTYEPLLLASELPLGLTPFESTASRVAELVGSTPDLSHEVLTSYASLTPNAFEGAREVSRPNVYVWIEGRLQLVNVRPDGTPTSAEAGFGALSGDNTRHAISNDGTRIVWSEEGPGYGNLYVRDISTQKTVQLNLRQGGTESGDGLFQIANSDVSMVFFTSSASLTEGSTANATNEDLYLFDVNTDRLTDLTTEDPMGAQVLGVVGASEDGSDVYVVARGALATGGVRGHNNLYALHREGTGWRTRFVVALADSDSHDWSATSLARMTARVSANGRYVAFPSDASLTGYDNRDAEGGQQDTEMYLYDAVAGSLVCASCNPSGARPLGGSDVPGWTPIEINLATYQSRYLSDDGRLFFDSGDAIVPQDVDGRVDVYEYEPVDTLQSTCGPESMTFSKLADGCISLISSGTSSDDSTFVDASQSGEDIFFTTRARLAPQDFDGDRDLYDAHVCRVTQPCFVLPAASPPVCTTGDSCKPAPSPQPSVFGAPATSTFSGIGNLDRPTDTTSAKAKAKVKKKPKKAKKRAKHREGLKKNTKRSAAGKSMHGRARR